MFYPLKIYCIILQVISVTIPLLLVFVEGSFSVPKYWKWWVWECTLTSVTLVTKQKTWKPDIHSPRQQAQYSGQWSLFIMRLTQMHCIFKNWYWIGDLNIITNNHFSTSISYFTVTSVELGSVVLKVLRSP